MPVHRLDVVGVVVVPGSAHPFGLDVIGNGVAEVAKFPPADRAAAFLLSDFVLEQAAHLCRRAKLAITAMMMRVFDSSHS